MRLRLRRLRPILATLLVALPLITPVSPIRTTSAGAQARPPSKVSNLLEKLRDDTLVARRNGRSPAVRNGHSKVDAQGRLAVTVWATGEVGGRERADLARLGARIDQTVSGPARRGKPAFGVFQVLVDASRLDDLAALSWVAAVTPVDEGVPDTHPTNTNNSEGVALHRADDAQTRGINGTGVAVGVISDGVSNLAAAQTGNDLPAVNVLNTGSGDEGTAMLEIVHDMAPGATLLFDTQGGVAGHAAALNNLVANGANVITEDLAFDTEPAFVQGLLASTGDNIAAAGVSIHSSAGNLGQRHAARVVANGTGQRPDNTANTFTGCTNTPDNVIAIAPSGDTTFDVTLGSSDTNNDGTPDVGASIVLQWSEPRAIFPTAGQGGFTDLNVYVMDQALTMCLAQSVGVQANGQGDTMEVVNVPANLGGTAAKIVVDVQGTSSAVAAPTIDLRWRLANAVDTPTRAGSLNPDSNYLGAATSAAAVFGSSGALEAFSAAGPVALITTTQCPGGAAGPCTGVAGGSAGTAAGPSWAAADGVTVSGAGVFSSPFFGTSAAAPHAAGCDALLRDALNNATAAPSVTNARLAVTATDIAPPGTDAVTGAGQLDCLAAVNNPPVANAGGPYATNEGTDVTLNGSASSDPDAGDSLTYAWDLDNDGAFDDSTAVSPSFTTVGQDGVFTVRLRVTDTAGSTADASSTVTVRNVAPVVAVAADGPKAENSAVRVNGVVTDPGWLDPLTATIDFGDGAGAQALPGVVENARPDATLTYDVLHVYGDNGTFTVTVCAADDDTTGNCKSTPVTVTNVDPTAVIDLTGTVLVNGIPTFLAHAGQTVPLSASSTDPGSDDITTTWNWDDGPPVPDVTTLSQVNPPLADPLPSPSVQPRAITDPEPHAFGTACLYSVGFGARDDDSGSAAANVNVIVTGNATQLRSAGYWYNAYRDRRNQFFPATTLECYLKIVGFMSTVFNERTNASTIALATRVLNPPGNVSATEQFDRQLLALWLNFANGPVDLTTLVDTNGDGVVDTSLAAVLSTAEAIRLNPLSTTAQVIAQKSILERINLRDGG